ncbi:MAG TPA: murein L,D-transpeptidase catalytic domain family protein [Longimicrobium sp.]|nr:murein L,D-transpeptidase catalytic domain family protein [Longimicrobium sp.]
MRRDLLILAAMATTAGAGGALLSEPSRHATAAPVAVVQPAPAVVPAPAPVRPVLTVARGVLETAGIESGAEAAQVQRAMAALAPKVKKQSDPNALQSAFKAYFTYKAANPEKVRKPYLYFVDYGLDSRTPRGYVFDMKELKLVDGPFTVSHGRGSAASGQGVPTRFGNGFGSAATSLGLFLAQETYPFSGKTGGKVYRSVGLRLTGLSGKYNNAARKRGVVVHGAPYVTATRAGRSEGCPAMEQSRASTLIPRISNGGLVFLFSPLDRSWKNNDPWLKAAA